MERGGGVGVRVGSLLGGYQSIGDTINAPALPRERNAVEMLCAPWLPSGRVTAGVTCYCRRDGRNNVSPRDS